jgi:hypothetical protein
MRLRKLLPLALFAGALGAPAAAWACPGDIHSPIPGEMPPAAEQAMPPAPEVIVLVPPEVAPAEHARGPIEYGRDYGRLLILLAVPAAFIGLHLHLSRRAHIVPPLP